MLPLSPTAMARGIFYDAHRVISSLHPNNGIMAANCRTLVGSMCVLVSYALALVSSQSQCKTASNYIFGADHNLKVVSEGTLEL